MKKLHTLLAALSFAGIASAQSQPSFGIAGGMIYSNLSGDAMKSVQSMLDYTNGMVSKEPHIGYYFGISGTLPISENVSVQPGINYSQKGAKLVGNFNLKGLDILSPNASAALQMNYFEVPLLLKASMGKGLKVFAGPQVSYLSNAMLQVKAGALGINLLDKSIDATPQFNRWNVGASAGLEYKLINNISISAAYDYGFSKLDKNKSVNSNIGNARVGLTIHF